MLLNRVNAATATTGTGPAALGAAVSPFQTWAAGGAVNGATYSYLIADGTAWELGRGVYSSGGTLTRPGPGADPTFASSTGALLNLSGAASIACVANVADFVAGSSGGAPGGNAADFASVVFAGDGTILHGNNVSSVTHVATGKYLINFATAASDVNLLLPSFAAINDPATSDNLVTFMINRATGDGVPGGLTANGCFVETFGTDAQGANDVQVGFARFGVVGSPAPGTVKLDSHTSGGGEASITLTVPAGFRAVRVIGSLRGDDGAGNQDAKISFNGDTAANYVWNIFQLSNGAVGGNIINPTNGVSACFMPCGGAPAGLFGMTEILIPAYDQTDRKKNFQIGSSNPNTPLLNISNAVWNNEAAITTITFTPNAGNFAAGTRFDLYGEV